jgi:HK97 family phage portal protein
VLFLGFIKNYSYIRQNLSLPMRIVPNISENWLSRTFVGNLIGFRSSNNKYISQPDFELMPITFTRSETWQSIDGLEREIYLTTPELRAVINRLATMFANGKWEMYNEKGEEVEHPLVERLEKPNLFQSRNEFLAQWMIQRCLYGNVFMYMNQGSVLDDAPQAIWNLSPSRIVVNRTGKIWKQIDIKDMISSYSFKLENGKEDIFTPNEILQFSMPDSDDPLLAPSPLLSIRMPISNIRAAYGYRNVILTKKGAIGVWSNEAKDVMGALSLTPKENKRLSQQLVRSYGIGDHQQSIVVSNKPLKWSPATYPTKDLMLFEEIDANKKAIIDLYGANDNMFSRGSTGQGSTFSNVENGNKQCYQDTIIPIANDLAYGIAQRYGLEQQGLELKLCYDHIQVLKQDEVQKADILLKKSQAVEVLLRSGLSPESVSEITGLELGTVKAMSAPQPL